MQNTVIKDLKIFAKHLRVLVVEDEKDIREEFCSTLKMFFAQVTSAENGREALELYKKQKYDIVITDINMPEVDGVELSKQLRILDKDQVIIVISGYIDTFVIDLIEVGIQSLIMKPYKLDKFFLTLLKQCENIVFRKEFEKMKLNKVNQKLSNKTNNTENSQLGQIAQELADSQSSEEHIEDIKKCFLFLDDIDDKMISSTNEELEEINEEFEELMNSILLYCFEDEHKEQFIKILKKYRNIFEVLVFPNELIDSMKRLVKSLEENGFGTNDLYNELEFLHDDIINFFKALFVDKNQNEYNHLLVSLIENIKVIEKKIEK